jgi:hypothetical protein
LIPCGSAALPDRRSISAIAGIRAISTLSAAAASGRHLRHDRPVMRDGRNLEPRTVCRSYKAQLGGRIVYPPVWRRCRGLSGTASRRNPDAEWGHPGFGGVGRRGRETETEDRAEGFGNWDRQISSVRFSATPRQMGKTAKMAGASASRRSSRSPAHRKA